MRAIGFLLGLSLSTVLLAAAVDVMTIISAGAVTPAAFIIAITPFFLSVYLCAVAMSYLLAWLASTSNAGLNTASAIAFLVVVIPIGTIVGPGWLLIAVWVLTGYITVSLPKVIFTVIGYAVGSLSQTAVPWLEQLARGFLVGVNAPYVLIFGLYAYGLLIGAVVVLSSIPGVAIIGIALFYALYLWFLLMPYFGLILSTDAGMKGALGRSVFLTPTSWFVCGLGSFFFLGSLGLHWIGALANGITLRVVSVTISPTFRTIVMRGGLAGNGSGFGTGTEYDMGNFIFSQAGTSPDVEHETGHQLSLALFGGMFHFVGWLEEIPTFPPINANISVYAENIADSNKSTPPATAVRVWN